MSERKDLCERQGHLWVMYPLRTLNVREWCARCKRWRDL